MELKIGDQLFAESRYHGIDTVTVEGFTKTQIKLSNGCKLRLPFRDGSHEIGSSGYSSTSYYTMTDAHKQRLIRNSAIKAITAVKWTYLPTKVLQNILTLIND